MIRNATRDRTTGEMKRRSFAFLRPTVHVSNITASTAGRDFIVFRGRTELNYHMYQYRAIEGMPMSSSVVLSKDTLVAFAAGAALPTIAWWWLGRRRRGDDESDDDDALAHNTKGTTTTSTASWNLAHAPYKMLLVVNMELGMGKGKLAAQCGHAAVGCYGTAQRACPAGVRAWNRTGCAKICVKVPSTVELEALTVEARQRSIPYYLVEDAGRTQIAAGSRTVLALFAPVANFEGFTDHLKLL